MRHGVTPLPPLTMTYTAAPLAEDYLDIHYVPQPQTGVGGSGAASYSFGSGLPGTAPLDGVTANGSASYTYDAAGDRTNAGQTTGDVYDAERRLTSWTVTGGGGKEAYDGEGHRVAHQTTSGVSTTTTCYVGNVEEVDAASGAVTKYYVTPAGTPAAVRVGTNSVTYLATDGLGSVSEALDGSGNVTATALYGPYGQTRYSTGTMPTARGYTGQRLDAASGLYYYNARYYDPATDQFVSADSAAAGLNRYAYVAGNPETATDPTGHRMDCGVDCTGGGSGGGTGNGTGSGGSGCTSDSNCGGCYSSCGGTGNGTGNGGSSGGGTKGGKCGGSRDCMTPPSGTSTAQATCDSHCQAKQVANDAALHFAILAAGLGALGLALGAIGGWLMSMGDIVIGSLLIGLGLQLGIFAFTAGMLAAMFYDEGSKDDSWFTYDHVTAANGQVAKIVGGMTVFDMTVVIGAALRATKFVTADAPENVQNAVSAFTGSLILTDGATGLLGLDAVGYIGKQEDLLSQVPAYNGPH